ncbi:glycosyltransferase [Leptothoe sp. PORK10 BA2]|uniref:glycosyltransferase n=1 Tax=Leptothoe sp. PORK10 BA2 TaxID=3110254 RepID=UPI002B1FB393|nr:glycosyltransferase [Leptothoe sp. PORK10 BA2]MEA5466500.1 glycosyltransferase [Leptothoe sp. PORK10 BA2]
MTLRVLHVIPSVSPVRGGPSKAIFEMAASLQDSHDTEVEIATTNDDGPDLLDVPLNQKIFYNGVNVWFFPRFSPKIAPVREFAFSFNLTKWLWENIQNYDLVHVHAIFSYPSTIAMAIARQKSVPYIVRPLGQLCEWSLAQSAQRKKIYLALAERKNLNGCNQVHLTSRQEQEEFNKLDLKSSSFILPHGLNVSSKIFDARNLLRAHFQLPTDEPVILFLSRIHPKKGLDYLIPALKSIADKRFTFILAGNGDPAYEEKVRELIHTNGLQDRIIMPGFIEGRLKELLLQGSDIFALTSYSENFGVAVLEALAAGTPALVTPGVALAHEVKEHQLGYVVPQNNADIAKALCTYLESPAEAKNSLSRRASEFVSAHYSWTRIAKELNVIYQNILTNKSTFDYA